MVPDVEDSQYAAYEKPVVDMTLRLHATYNAMMRMPRLLDNARTSLSKSLLSRACLGFILDLERMNLLFAVEIRHIRAACLFRWLSRVRPVQIYGQGATPEEMEANALFAVVAALSELKINEIGFINSDWLWACVKVSAYGDIHPGSWAILFGVLEEQYPAVTNPKPAGSAQAEAVRQA